MKQTILVAAITFAGAIGAFAVEPSIGVVVYYFFAVLRPQAIWEWALPMGIPWSAMVGWSTIVASAWFRSPDTHRVSPHLSWVNRVVLDHGGFVAVHGPADPACGVFARSTTRRRLYEAGSFRPTLGLVIWPRRAMIAWADAHPELAD